MTSENVESDVESVKEVKGTPLNRRNARDQGVNGPSFTSFTPSDEQAQILALDLSLAATGVAKPDGSLATIKPTTKRDERLGEIDDKIADIIDQHDLDAGNEEADDYALDLVVIEDLPTGLRNAAAGSLGMLHGAVRVGLMRIGVPYLTVPPASLKTYATGRGNCTKADMRVELLKRTGQDVADDNQADAAWLRLLGLDLLGCPELQLPQTHRRALTKLALPNMEKM